MAASATMQTSTRTFSTVYAIHRLICAKDKRSASVIVRGCLAYRRLRVSSPWQSWLLHPASYIDDDQTDNAERHTGRSDGDGIGALPSVTGKAVQ